MADTTDPQIIAFSDGRVRPLADKLTALYYALLAFEADYTAQTMAAKLTAAGMTATLPESSGRTIITCREIVNLRLAAQQLKASMEALVAGPNVSPKVIADGIQVNGSPR